MAQEFALDILNLSNALKKQKEHSFADQVKRSGTSISANIAEANHPQSRSDMVSKFEIALKEANETEKWLTLFKNSKILKEDFIESSHKKLIKIKILLISSIKTLKNK